MADKKKYKIDSKSYDYIYLRKYLPYVIRSNINDDYYILNRDYEYIGLNTKSITSDIKENIYLFDDGSKPWDKKQYWIKYVNLIRKTIKDRSLNKCLNTDQNTVLLLSEFFT